MTPQRKTFVCPHCGELISAKAAACPHCGADERTGWSDSTYLDGIDLGDGDDYESLVEKEFGGTGRRQKHVPWQYVLAAALLLGLFVLGFLFRAV